MKKLVFNVAISVLAIVFITILGIDEIKTARTGLGIVTLIIAATNIPVIYLHWYQYKNRKTFNDVERVS